MSVELALMVGTLGTTGLFGYLASTSNNEHKNWFLGLCFLMFIVTAQLAVDLSSCSSCQNVTDFTLVVRGMWFISIGVFIFWIWDFLLKNMLLDVSDWLSGKKKMKL